MSEAAETRLVNARIERRNDTKGVERRETEPWGDAMLELLLALTPPTPRNRSRPSPD
jgi:hypothetical protein